MQAMQQDDEALSGLLSARLIEARRQLLERMARHGCHADDGWRIHEELANSPTGTAYVLRAVHRVYPSAAELAVVVPVTNPPAGLR